MEKENSNPVARFLPSMTDLVFLMPLVFLFVRLDGASHLLGDGDTGWHIRTGDWILAHGRVPTRDIFSFTMPDAPWFAWEWLWDVSMAWLHARWGLTAVVFASCLVLSFTYVLLFRLILRHCANRFLAIAAVLAACAGSSMHWLARPHLVTLLFTVLFLMEIDRLRNGDRRSLIMLPAMMVIWTNLHGGFLVGLTILAAWAAGELLRAAFTIKPEARIAALRSAKQFGLLFAACTAATLINPYTYHLHLHILGYFSQLHHLARVSEFQSVDFHHPASIFYEPALIGGVVAAYWAARRRRFAEALIVIGWMHLGLYAVRNIPIYLLVSGPLIAEFLDRSLAPTTGSVPGWLKRLSEVFRSLSEEFAKNDAIPRVHASSAFAALILLVFLTRQVPPKFVSEYDGSRFPESAVAWLSENGGFGNIFTDDEWGDYLIYKRSTQGVRVFVDGRSDFYGDTFNDAYMRTADVRYDWEKPLRQYGVDTILLRADSALASTVKESSRWRLVYDDTRAVVFRAVGYPALPNSIANNSGWTRSEAAPHKGGDRMVAAIHE